MKRKKEFEVEIEGQDGKLVMELEIYRLTESLVIVEAKRKSGDSGVYKEIWENKLKHLLMESESEASTSNHSHHQEA